MHLYAVLLEELPIEIWDQIMEHFTTVELRRYCGLCRPVFEIAMKRLYCEHHISSNHDQDASRSQKRKQSKHVNLKLSDQFDCLRNPTVAYGIRKLGLNLRSLAELVVPPGTPTGCIQCRQHPQRDPPAIYRSVRKLRSMLSIGSLRKRSSEQRAAETLLDATTKLESLDTLSLCLHSRDRFDFVQHAFQPTMKMLVQLSPKLKKLSFRVIPHALPKLLPEAPIPNFQLQELEISLHDCMGCLDGTPLFRTISSLVSQNAQSLTFLEISFSAHHHFKLSDFFVSLGELELPHLSRFFLSFSAEDPFIPDPQGLCQFFHRHGRLEELLLSLYDPWKSVYRCIALLDNLLGWYHKCFRSLSTAHHLKTLSLGLYNQVLLPLFTTSFQLTTSIMSSVTSLNFTLPPISVGQLRLLLPQMECSQLRALGIYMIKLDYKIVPVLMTWCPELERLSIRVYWLMAQFGDIWEEVSRFNEAIAFWSDGSDRKWELVDLRPSYSGFQWVRGGARGGLTLAERKVFAQECDVCGQNTIQ